MNVSSLIKSEFNLTFLSFLNCLSNIHCYSTSLWRWHKSLWSELFSYWSQISDQFWSCNQNIKVSLPFFNILKKSIMSSDISTSLLRFINLVFCNEYSYLLSFSSSVRKDCSSSKHLIVVLWISVSLYSNFNSCVKLSIIHLFKKLNSLSQRIHFCLFYKLFHFYILFSVFHDCNWIRIKSVQTIRGISRLASAILLSR